MGLSAQKLNILMKTDWQPLIHLILEFTANYYKYAQKKLPSQKKDKDLVLFLPWNILLVQMTLNFA